MKTQRLLIAITVANLFLFLVAIATMRPALAQGRQEVAPVLRARALQIVDERGEVRASLSVLPPAISAHGDRSPEMVLLRLITERGRPSVKISASEVASGVSLAGPSGTSSTYVILEAKGNASSLLLKNENGREQRLTP